MTDHATRDRPTYRLPIAAYTDEAWFDRDMRAILERSWVFAGILSDIPASGDYLTLTVGRIPLVIVRQPDGSVRAFHNICRHRGAVILEGRGNVSTGVSCFYHRWHYNLDGSLRGAPQIDQFPELSGDGKRDFGLKPASIGTWRSFIFVCASTEPRESLADWLVGVEDAFGPWDPAGMLEVEPSSFEMAANWKLFLENHIDGLHLWHLHARSVLGVAHDRQAWQACGRHWLFYEPPEIAGSMPDRDLTGLPPLTEVGEDRHGSSVFMFFPDTGGAGGVTFFTIFRVEPLSTARTRVQLRTFIKPLEETDFITDPHLADRLALATRPAVPGGESESNRATLSTAERLRRAADRMDFVEEDKIAAESVQRGYASGAYLPGPLSVDYEAAIDFYHRSCQEFLDRGPA